MVNGSKDEEGDHESLSSMDDEDDEYNIGPFKNNYYSFLIFLFFENYLTNRLPLHKQYSWVSNSIFRIIQG